MTDKIKRMITTYEDTIANLTSSPDEWAKFLGSAARNYKLPFDDQVMVYAQKPEAAAVLEINKWSSVYGRWVNRGTTGIAVFEKGSGHSRLRYYFDISDTHETVHAKPVPIWEVEPEAREAVAESFSKYVDEDKKSGTPMLMIFNACAAVTKDNIPAYEDLMEENLISRIMARKDTPATAGSAKRAFRQLVTASVTNQVSARLGLGTSAHGFGLLSSFTDREDIKLLGGAVRDISGILLRDAATAVLAQKQKQADNISIYSEDEIGAERSEENDRGERDDDGRETRNHLSRGDSGIQEPGRDNSGKSAGTDTGSGASGSAGEDPGQVRRPAAEIPEGERTDALRQARDILRTVGAPERSAGKSVRHGLGDDGEDRGAERGDGGYERHRHAEVGGDSLERESDGRAAGDQGIHNGVTGAEIDNEEMAEGKSSPFSFGQISLFDGAEENQSSSGEIGEKTTEDDNRAAEAKGDAGAASAGKNFVITNSDLGHGGAKEKYRFNREAIRTLKKIEDESRAATAEEQQILSRYVGFGGLAEAFDEANAQWETEYKEMKELLTPAEYDSARATTLNAHYTAPVVIRKMYEALAGMGFEKGNILEPSCGVGNFMGLLPGSMKGSSMYGVEIDSLTGRLARQLYPENKIFIEGFESADFSDNFFDAAIGNVPFGGYSVADKRYDKHHFMIHDYFFAKTLDKVRPGGIVAFITSKGTLDKKNPGVRKYIAQRAELLGAIRLPNNAFLKNAGTSVTSDIIFLKKRDRIMMIEPDWVHLGMTEEGVPVNSYFADNPAMVLGRMTTKNSMYGKDDDTTCEPIPGAYLTDQLTGAIRNIGGSIEAYERDEDEEESADTIPADPDVRNHSFTIVNDQVYFRENSIMKAPTLTLTAQKRILGMIGIRDSLRILITYQTEDYSDERIVSERKTLSHLYDEYVKKYGRLFTRANKLAFGGDSSYPLLCSLEKVEEGKFAGKADIFTKRTIRPAIAVTSVDTPAEALVVSISERAGVDMPYMSQITGMSEKDIFYKLRGDIYFDASSGHGRFAAADEFLSGNIREKLRAQEEILIHFKADMKNGQDPDEAKELESNIENTEFNIEALTKVLPKDIPASEISVRLGTTWIPADIIEQFTLELLEPVGYVRSIIKAHYSPFTATWDVENKNKDPWNIKANSAYGTKRINAYRIIENTLNLKDVRIFDYVKNENGNKVAVLNKKETMIAQQKQDAIKAEFKSWIFSDPDRRARLTKLYNEKFNSLRAREYDGSHIALSGINSEIEFFKHQKDAVAQGLYGGNALFAHVVGAGKTFTMTAIAMERKRLGLCAKSLLVVPNHLIEQWASEFLYLYPGANILASTKKDFETQNRKRFCSRIATGEYDAVIIGHSQFEKIPLSQERQASLLSKQIEDIGQGIEQLKRENGERFSIKQLEKTKKQLEVRMMKLNDQSKKDDVVTFEELGVDCLFVDEAHYYKNLYLYTKMRNVSGISGAQKSSDLFAKCRYLDEITDNRGTIFATGTPISNSMTELYTMQRYLQYDELEKMGLKHFDNWASTFGETQTAIELAPEGTGYRAKTRFAKFFNLPELMMMFRQVADIKTADMLNLPVPIVHYHNVSVKPSEIQKELVASLSERADAVRNRLINPSQDNMLVITNDGRKIALDVRLVNPLLADEPNSKVSACADDVYETWENSKAGKLTQLVFCDMSTPKEDGSFNVYDDLKEKLVSRGVTKNEIAFVHTAKTNAQKKELFAKVRSGKIRVLIGSTQKLGAGTNVQDRLVAIRDLDCPWRPSDLEQRAGRIKRQGNRNKDVHISRYVTEGTFDAYMYQLIESKQRFIGQIMTSRSPARTADDVDEASLSYAEIKALAAGDPHIKEKMDLDIKVTRLKTIQSSFLEQKYVLEDKLVSGYPAQIKKYNELILAYKTDIEMARKYAAKDFGSMTVDDKTYTEAKAAGEAIIAKCAMISPSGPQPIGTYKGFDMRAYFNPIDKTYTMQLHGAIKHNVTLGTDARGNITRIDNAVDDMPGQLISTEAQLENIMHQAENAKEEACKPFPQEEELREAEARLAELNGLLNMNERDHDDIGLDDGADEDIEAEYDIGPVSRAPVVVCECADDPVIYTPAPDEQQYIQRSDEEIER